MVVNSILKHRRLEEKVELLLKHSRGRADGYDLTVDGNGVIGQGVVQNTDGSFSTNTKEVTAREWQEPAAWTGGRSIC